MEQGHERPPDTELAAEPVKASVKKQLEKDLKETISDCLHKWLVTNGLDGDGPIWTLSNHTLDAEGTVISGEEDGIAGCLHLKDVVGCVSRDICLSNAYKRVSRKIVSNYVPTYQQREDTASDHRESRSHSRLSFIHSQSADDFVSAENVLEAARSLDPYRDPQSKLDALKLIGSFTLIDHPVSESVWRPVGKALVCALADVDGLVSKAALGVFVKLLTCSQSSVVRNAYCSLLKFLRHQLHVIGHGMNHADSSSSRCKCTWFEGTQLFHVIIMCNAFQRCLPKHWLRYPKQDARDIVQGTFRLLSGRDIAEEETLLELWYAVSMTDPGGVWIRNWMYGSAGRAQVVKCIGDFPRMPCLAVKWCLQVLSTLDPEDAERAGRVRHLFRHFLEVFGSLLEYGTGRQAISTVLSGGSATTNWLQFLRAAVELSFHASRVFEFRCILRTIERVCLSLCRTDRGQSSAEEAVFQALVDVTAYPLKTFFEHPLGCRDQDVVMVQRVVECLTEVSHYDKGRRILLLIDGSDKGPEDGECLGIVLFKKCVFMLTDTKAYDHSSRPLLEDLLHFSANFLECPRNLLLVTTTSDALIICIRSLNGNIPSNSNQAKLALSLLRNPLSVGILEDSGKLKHWMPSVLKQEHQTCLVGLLSNLTFAAHVVNTDGLQSLARLVWKRFLEDLQHNDTSFDNYYVAKTMYNWISMTYSYPGAIYIVRDSLSEESRMCNSLLLLPKSLCSAVESVCDDGFLHLLGLRVLCTLLTCLKMNLYLRSHTYALDFLLDHLNGCAMDNGKMIVDESTVLCNHCVIRMLSVGSTEERNLPPNCIPRLFDNLGTQLYPWPFVTSSMLPENYTTSLHQQRCEDSDLLQKVFAKLNTEPLAMTRILEALTTDDNRHLSKVFLVLEKTVTSGQWSTTTVEDVPYVFHGNQSITQEEKYGIQMTVGYAKLLGLSVDDLEDALEWLISQVAEKVVYSQSHKPHLVFDFFVATVFLLGGCDAGRSLSFLRHFASSAVAPFLWTDQRPKLVKVTLCQYFEMLLKEWIPLTYAAFQTSSYPPSLIYEQWTRQCFWNYLDWAGICSYLLLCVLKGGDYSLYFCVAVLKHLELRVLKKAQCGNLVQFLKEESICGFDALKYLDFMRSLEDRYHDMIANDVCRHLASG